MGTLYDYCKEKSKEYLLQEWDYELNKDFDVKTILAGSNKKVWWKCAICGHEWQTSIGGRTRGSGCPICAKERSRKARSLSVNMINPETNEIVKTFSSISEAGKSLHINSSNINSVCRGIRNFAGGYKWKYAEQN